MAPRLELQTLLENLLGSTNVYFQPPENISMAYPCITYERYIGKSIYADNIPYNYTERYQVTVIDQNPDSEILDKVIALPMCLKNRHFKVNGLNHDIFNLYY